ncbi:S-adenosyl-L-methionine-dependent methyltransferase [Epithele typhae]|uniref:S-adenosyl-L-methionine-dependent methyltransferase n=1 Tax=Epithele typhae TaxID=378194 RepID=UPI002007A320|nr:S-adenosyl-L-methionine-dependent methyltransferase [Epithele typhae]KAH9932061.1 S-adenosyl-L-methionine-dependent methyltransferase [Epithele typhae]
MPRRPQRPSAFGVSFGSDDGSDLSAHRLSVGSQDEAASSDTGRQSKEAKTAKRRKAGKHCHVSYHPTSTDIPETAAIEVLGEDPDDLHDANNKPVRALDNFEVFNPSSHFKHVGIDELHRSSGVCQAAGFVSPVFISEEDAGQEDDGEGGGDDDDPTKGLQHLRTESLKGYSLDYCKMDDPFYIETQFAWYCLKRPSQTYRRTFVQFYRPHRIVQLIISVASEGRIMQYGDFEEEYIGSWDPALDEHLQMEDFIGAVGVCRRTKLRKCAFVKHILSSQSSFHIPLPPSTPLPQPAAQRILRLSIGIAASLDLAVLQPQNQTPTHVTPLIDALAQGLFHEHLQVVGAQLPLPTKGDLKRRQKARFHFLVKLLSHLVSIEQHKISWAGRHRLSQQPFWGAVTIDGEEYKVGDCVLIQAGRWKGRSAARIPTDLEDIPETASVADYFWFAKIIYINQQNAELHVQYFEHSSKTILGEISNPQELFLCNIGKVTVHYNHPQNKLLNPAEFFCNFIYSEVDGSFSDIPEFAPLPAGDNCPVCCAAYQLSHETAATASDHALYYLGATYHQDDYILFRPDDANQQSKQNLPASVGRILDIHTPIAARAALDPEATQVTVQLLGRVGVDLKDLPDSLYKHERELFHTRQQVTIPAVDILNKCYVLHHTSCQETWLARSPFHFYLKYTLRSLGASWKHRTELKASEVPVCPPCHEEQEDAFRESQKLFSGPTPKGCLRAFDPFAGIGAFGMAMEATGSVKVTHAVEISPSAATALKKNSPSTTVYNQCSNLVLQHSIKTYQGQPSGRLKDIKEEKPLPPPPTPSQIDCIIAGFPCQPHSTLNMFQKANDRKSHLILNLLSWVDFLKPKFCFFENVKGFLSYRLHAHQAGKHRLKGGIKLGGLKFLVYALVQLKYQVRFALLQAGHYGTPQSRVRFFLIAAKQGQPLPQMPQPTHSSLFNESLEIHLPDPDITDPIRPILTTNGTAAHRYVCIEDAIGDLPSFDWEHPQHFNKKRPRRRQGHRTVKNDPDEAECGPTLARGREYDTEPRTSYQARCRERPTTDLQHVTRTYKPETVESVELLDWQSSNPLSAIAREGYRKGLYGRLDRNRWFHTTVTNVEPTAKQSYVIHYADHRTLTVRELARSQGFPDWFVFVAEDGKVKTMQRQIGNAVPWQIGEALGRELKKVLIDAEIARKSTAIEISDEE